VSSAILEQLQMVQRGPIVQQHVKSSLLHNVGMERSMQAKSVMMEIYVILMDVARSAEWRRGNVETECCSVVLENSVILVLVMDSLVRSVMPPVID
jgi:hypothetical protein